MYIWIVNQNAVPSTQAGITRHFFLAKKLEEMGHKVLIVASDFSHFSRKHIFSEMLDESKVMNIDGINFLWIPSSGYNKSLLKRFLATFEFYLRMQKPCIELGKQKRPDLILGSSPQLLAALGAWRVSKKLGAKFVSEIRDIWPLSAKELGGFSWLNPGILLLKLIEVFLYRKSIRIISIPPNADSYFRKYGVAERVRYISNFINEIPHQNSRLLETSTEPKEYFTAMYLGSFGIANNIENIVNAAKMLEKDYKRKDIRIRLIGGGPQKQAIVDAVKAQGLKYVSIEDPVPKSMALNLLHEADCFLMPLKKASVFKFGVSPNKLYDYMLAAKPTIFAVDSENDPISNSRGGLKIAAEDPKGLAHAIIKLAEMSAEDRRLMGIKARSYALENFSLNLAASKLSNVLSEVQASPQHTS